MREEYNKWMATLNEFDIAYFEREYTKLFEEIDYKEFDGYLFNLWVNKNEN